MKKISELDEAELRAEMRQMYKNIGLVGAYQCLYEIMFSASILMEVINEELDNEKKG